MDYYFRIRLSHRVKTSGTRKGKAGVNTCVCRAANADEAVAQLLPQMRSCVSSIERYRDMRSCYPNPDGILKEDIYV